MFQDRQHAGRLLTQKLTDYHGLVLGITRGGVIVANEIADNLKLPLQIIVVKKLSAPFNPELAIGAVTEEKTTFIDPELVERVGASKKYISQETKTKQNEVVRLQKKIQSKKRMFIKGKNIIVVDDGIATGATTEVVIQYLKKKKARKIILAVPVISFDIYEKLKKQVNSIIALEIADSLSAVGQFYESFPQVSDEEVIKIVRN